MNDKNLSQKTTDGLFWSFTEVIVGQGLKLVVQIILARLLIPADFGLIGMITVLISISQAIVEGGFINALIRDNNPTQEDYSTVFYFNLVMSFMIYIILFISADYISSFYSEPLLTSIIKVLSVVIIINSFGLIQRAMLTKKIDFRTQTIISLISNVISGVVGVFLAFKGFGVWSLVVQSILIQLMESILLTIGNKWVPSLVFSKSSFKKYFEFGSKLLLSRIFSTIYDNVYYLIIGKVYSSTDLGYYTNSKKLRDVASSSITTAVEKVSYPVLSSINNNCIRLKNGYKKILLSSVFITFPLMIGLVVTAPNFIKLLFGDAWLPSIPYFQLLSLSGTLLPLQAINLNILKVMGRTDRYLYVNVVKKLVGLTIIGIIVILRLGIIGLLWGLIFNSIIAYFINSYYSGDLLSYSTKDQIKDILPNMFVTLMMGIITFIAGKIIETNLLITLLTQIIIGILSYIAMSKVMKIKELQIITNVVSNFYHRVIER